MEHLSRLCDGTTKSMSQRPYQEPFVSVRTYAETFGFNVLYSKKLTRTSIDHRRIPTLQFRGTTYWRRRGELASNAC